jgi:hypothetical protein
MTIPSVEQLAKLPQWARTRINDLEMQRDAAVRELDAFVSTHDTGPVMVHLMSTTSDGGPTHREVRFDAHWIQIDHCGIRLDITLAEGELRLAYGTRSNRTGAVYLKPTSFQQLSLLPIPTRP